MDPPDPEHWLKTHVLFVLQKNILSFPHTVRRMSFSKSIPKMRQI
jgi:hypothetical protein